ncbi:hypothetical protein QLX08_005664 [Tetragonisca angustula]|uniref:DUF4485 domain-containing protein n=1 Tax=Tetragonisca angustula TaxID=166442 RepID=A0AAW0ZXA0_9HYME
MPKIREYNDEAVKLDECFKETLSCVRPFVLALTSPESAQLCKIWLNKLNAVSSQRRLRNEYLAELFRQLKTGHIGGVFSRPPPNGFLLPLPKSYHMVCISSSVSNLSDYTMKSHHSCVKPNAKCTQHQRRKTLLKHRTMDITKLQAQNEYLRDQLSEYRKNCNRNANDYLSSSISQLTTDVTTLKVKLKEMEQLKNSMDESYKETVQEYHFTVVEQFTELKQQLAESRLKSEALDHSIVLMAKKLEQISYGKDEQSKIMEQQWIDKIKTICERFDSFTKEKNKELQLKQDLLEKKDTELLKKDVRRREEIELLINKIHDLETKLEMKIRDEDKLQKIINEQYTVMREELNKMRIEMDNETQKQNQNLTSQVSTLKKAIVKLAKSKEKLEYNYEKKLSHIIKNKDTEIKFLHLQLQKQKNELYTSLSTEKQNEVDNIASALEKRYKALLAETEAMSETKTQEYLMRIAILEDQILNMKKFESSL